MTGRRQPQAASLAEVLRRRAAEQPGTIAYTFCDGDAEASITYRELDVKARTVAAAVQGVCPAGERVLLLLPPGLDYVAAFFGCLYAGAVAVPAYPPRGSVAARNLARLEAILRDAQATAVIADSRTVHAADRLSQVGPGFSALHWLVLGELDERAAGSWVAPQTDPDALAFLQYTSGSTAQPKGVMVRHGHLMSNCAAIEQTFGLDPSSRAVIWLPPYHDMGLIGGILQALFTGYPTVLMPPAEFARRPLRWLETVSSTKATVSGGPNFAYELCTHKIAADEVERLDLSSWRVAFNGAEPIRADVMERFAAFFAPARFHAGAFSPCYGLAEGTLIVSGVRPGRGPVVREQEMPGHHRAKLVSCGPAVPGQRILIVDPVSQVPCRPGREGEIWVAGPSVAAGYWARPEQTADTFGAMTATEPPDGPFLRTGDLGLLDEGELFVTGRIKDLVIQRGVNHYPQDIETTAARAYPGLQPGGAAAFTVLAEGAEQLVVAQEVVARHTQVDLIAASAAIREAVSAEHELTVHDLVLVRFGRLPRTSSGKIQRHAARQRYLAGQLDVLTSTAAPRCPRPGGRAPVTTLEMNLQAAVGRRLGRPAADVDLDCTGTRLGLDSLSLLELQHEIESAFQLELSPEDLYTATLRDVARRIEASAAEPGGPPDGQADDEDGERLSHGQQGLWLLDRLADAGAAYNLAGAVRFETQLDLAALDHALQALIDRHDALRTTFMSGPDGPVLTVAARLPSPLTVHRGEAPGDDLLSERAATRFDLEHGSLLRADLWADDPDGPVLLLAMHHIIADFWSAELLLGELAAHYRGATTGEQPTMLPAPGYGEFVAWQSRFLRSGAGRVAGEYWQQQLGGELPWLALPTDRPRPPVQGFRGGRRPFSLRSGLSQRIAELARARETSLYTVLVSAFLVLLHRWSGQDEVLVGSPASGRTSSAAARTVGYLVNPVVLRGRFAADPTFEGLLADTAAQVSHALAYQDYPFALLVKQLRAAHDPSRSPVFQAMFMLQDSPLQQPALAMAAIGHPAPGFERHGLRMRPIPVHLPTAQFDVTVAMARDETGRLHGSLQYNLALFDPRTADRLAESFLTLLESVADHPGAPVGRLAVVPPAERGELLHRWNDTGREVPVPRCIHDQFEAMAAAQPTETAVVLRDEALTYGELARQVADIAGRLRAAGAGPGALVGICATRSPQLVGALLGVLETGAAYVPLDPEYPASRLAQILADTSPPIILADRPGRGRLPETTATILPVDGPPADEAEGRTPTVTGASVPAEPGSATSPDLIAYILHTSGSTGTPKGVMVSHRNVVNFFAGVDEQVGCGPGDTLLAVTSVAFDISVLELLWTVTRGARVVIVEESAVGRRAAAAARRRPLDVSLFYFASADRASTGYRLVTDGARFADQHEFTAVWTPERHFHEFGGLYPNPSVLSAALATITERVALRAGSVVLPLHDPIRVAEEWSLVDNLSGGRVGVAFASGWHADDFVFFPHRYQDRKEHLSAAVRVVHDLWEGRPAKVLGGSGTEVEVRIHPPPVQPTLPTWITSAGSPDTFERAGQAGFNVLTHLLGQSLEQVALNIRRYRQARAEHGHDPAAGVVTMMLHTFIGRDGEQIREMVREPFTAYLRSSVGLIENLVRSMSLPLDLAAMTESDMDALLAFAFDRYFESSALFGTAESVQPMLDRLCAIDVDEVACLIDFGLPDDTVLGHLDQLAGARDAQHAAATAEAWSLAETVRRYQPTLFQCTPSMMRMITGDPEALSELRSLRTLLLGGEELPPRLADQVTSELPDTRLINMYGPTETTVWSAAHSVTGSDSPVPIGMPLVNTQLYIVDSAMEPVPLGAVGELLIGGQGVACGYWNRAAATADRFVPDPFGGPPGSRLYRTGDLARRRGDGRVEFLGRADRQVKIQGHRIELGDVEHALGRMPEVSEAVVVATEAPAGETRLAAYLVPAPGANPTQAELTHRLRADLPPVMVPAVFITLPELPLTSNGKIDVRSLPRAVPSGLPGPAGAAPASELERRIAGVWCEVLGVSDVGRYDNFFDIGGHSLLMVQVHSRLTELIDGELPLVKLLEHPTVGSLAAYLSLITTQPSFQETQDRAARQRRSRRDASRRAIRPSGAAQQ